MLLFLVMLRIYVQSLGRILFLKSPLAKGKFSKYIVWMIRAILESKFSRVGMAWLCVLVAAPLAVGATIKPYRVPKQENPTSPPPLLASEPPKEVATWKTPAGWEELPPGEMRLGSFRVKDQAGQQADVSIIPLPGLAGGDLENVNRWRGQVGLMPVPQDELATLTEKIEIAGGAAQLYDLAGQPSGSSAKTRILAAIQRRQGVVFFYKMTGEDALVASQKPTFTSFLQSVRFQAPESVSGGLPPSHPPIAPATGSKDTAPALLPASHPPINGQEATLPASHPPIGDAARPQAGGQASLPASHPPIDAANGQAGAFASAAKPGWKVPGHWQEQAHGPMQTAKFVALGDGGAKAEATVAEMPGDGGGPLANVNRWRGQIGLGPVAAGDLAKETSVLEVGAAKAMVLDATSSDKQKRLIVASVPRDGRTAFFKLMGDEPVVAKEKQAFLQFVQSAK